MVLMEPGVQISCFYETYLKNAAALNRASRLLAVIVDVLVGQVAHQLLQLLVLPLQLLVRASQRPFFLPQTCHSALKESSLGPTNSLKIHSSVQEGPALEIVQLARLFSDTSCTPTLTWPHLTACMQCDQSCSWAEGVLYVAHTAIALRGALSSIPCLL